MVFKREEITRAHSVKCMNLLTILGLQEILYNLVVLMRPCALETLNGDAYAAEKTNHTL
jgi:hypothetical protein